MQGDRFVARSLRWYRRLWQPANQLRRCVMAGNVSTALVTGERISLHVLHHLCNKNFSAVDTIAAVAPSM